jgi:hypothetical protein
MHIYFETAYEMVNVLVSSMYGLRFNILYSKTVIKMTWDRQYTWFVVRTICQSWTTCFTTHCWFQLATTVMKSPAQRVGHDHHRHHPQSHQNITEYIWNCVGLKFIKQSVIRSLISLPDIWSSAATHKIQDYGWSNWKGQQNRIWSGSSHLH